MGRLLFVHAAFFVGVLTGLVGRVGALAVRRDDPDWDLVFEFFKVSSASPLEENPKPPSSPQSIVNAAVSISPKGCDLLSHRHVH